MPNMREYELQVNDVSAMKAGQKGTPVDVFHCICSSEGECDDKTQREERERGLLQ